MVDARSNYKVLGKYIDGAETTGYGLIDKDNNKLKVKLNDFIDMVKNNMIEDYKYINTETKEYVIPKNGMESKLEILNTEQFRVKDRVFDQDGLVVGYTVIDNNDEELKLSKGKVWELAFEGAIKDARASYIEEGDVIKRLLILNI